MDDSKVVSMRTFSHDMTNLHLAAAASQCNSSIEIFKEPYTKLSTLYTQIIRNKCYNLKSHHKMQLLAKISLARRAVRGPQHKIAIYSWRSRAQLFSRYKHHYDATNLSAGAISLRH